MAYTVGRGWIEYLRIDTANHFFGVRLNVWTSVVVFLLAACYFVVSARRHPGREVVVQGAEADGDEVESTAPDAQPTDAEDRPVGEETPPERHEGVET